MPAIELHVPRVRPASSKLRTLIEKPDAVILRRNRCDMELHSHALRSRVRVNAVLALDVTHPPQPSGEGAEADDFSEQFCKGLELWVRTPAGPVRVYADESEIEGALTMFEAYSRVENFQQAFSKLHRREIGLTYNFREGMEIGVNGTVMEETMPSEGLAALSPIVELEDEREPQFVLRLAEGSISDFEQVMRDALRWLNENSYANVLGI
jgi:hypothetical protein